MTGCINTSLPAKDSVFDNCRLSAEQHNLQHEVLGPEEVAARFPGYRLPPGFKVRVAPDSYLFENKGFMAKEITNIPQGGKVRVCKTSRVPGLDMEPAMPGACWDCPLRELQCQSARNALDCSMSLSCKGGATIHMKGMQRQSTCVTAHAYALAVALKRSASACYL